jgi:hypothetical protein
MASTVRTAFADEDDTREFIRRNSKRAGLFDGFDPIWPGGIARAFSRAIVAWASSSVRDCPSMTPSSFI